MDKKALAKELQRVAQILSYDDEEKATLIFYIPYGEYTWATLMPLGGLISIIYGLKQRKKEKVKTLFAKTVENI